MANFDVAIRRSYKDVAGLILDCSLGDLRAISGDVETWFNRAPPAPTGVARFGDPFQDDATKRPALGPGNVVRFDRANAEFLKVPLVGTFASTQDWSFAFELVKGASTANDQVVFASDNGDLVVYRRKAPGGDLAYDHSGGTVFGTGDLGDGVSLFALNGGATVDWLVDNVLVITAGAISNLTFPTQLDSMLIGRSSGGGDEFDGDLSSMRAWRRQLSPLERDFVYQSLGPTDLSTANYAVTAHAPWTDDTGDPDLGQISRLNPLSGREPLFALATGSLPTRAQFACQVDGEVLPDSGLGGDLFVPSIVERAGNALPALFQDAGFSAIADVEFGRVGHYTLLFTRPNGGAKVVHIDVRTP